MTLDQRLRDAAAEAHQAVSGRRTPLNPVSARAVVGRRVVPVLAALVVAAALTVTSLVMRGDPRVVPVGNADPTSTAATDGDTTSTTPPTTTTEVPSTTAAVAYPMPEAPFISPDLGLELDPEAPESGLPLEPFIDNARSRAVPVELYGDIRVAYQAAAAIVGLEPVRYELRDVRGVGDLPGRDEAGHFLIRGEPDVLVYFDSWDFSTDHDPFAGQALEDWGTLKVNVAQVVLEPNGREVALFGMSVTDGGVWVKRVSAWFAPVEGGPLPLSEEMIRQVVLAMFEAVSGTEG
jgi:hypothetical protein